MSGVNAMYAHFEEVTVTGIPALFTPQRIDHTTVPTGMFQYEIRHDDEDWCDPCQLAKGVMVNFYGTILTSNPIQLGADGKPQHSFNISQMALTDTAKTNHQYLHDFTFFSSFSFLPICSSLNCSFSIISS